MLLEGKLCEWHKSPRSGLSSLLTVSGELLGLCHYVCYPSTWSDCTVCYLEDVFVAPVAWRLGVATSFVEKLKSIVVEENWTRVARAWIAGPGASSTRGGTIKKVAVPYEGAPGFLRVSGQTLAAEI
ncbi:GNAT family N-acetyltransferase [Paraburkholderia oxyphila]|uniref:GNAT family N-acetyltransferase n=1 Tax=Paraburkholderia oxyphila TaxID=614212 RepID=UPI0038994E37